MRELRNIAERFSVLSSTNTHYEDLIEELIGQEAKEQLAFEDTKKGFRPELSGKQITDVLDSCRGNREMAAKQLGISRSTLWRKMKELGIEAVYK